MLSEQGFQPLPAGGLFLPCVLGNAYIDRIEGNKAENIEQELSAYHQALEVRTQSAFPKDWAGMQYNLGNSYNNRIKGDKAENIEQAISAYHQALQVYTQSAFPQDWSKTQNNLGVAYWKRMKGDKAENIEQAISAYHQALQVDSRYSPMNGRGRSTIWG